MTQGGTRGHNHPGDVLLSATAVLPVLRSVAYRLREEYLTERKLFNSTEAIAWAVANLEFLQEAIESGDPTYINAAFTAAQVRVGEDGG